jgi:hypothetical protein
MMGKGWAIPGHATKAHYFDNDVTSLCRKWALLFARPEAFEDSNDDHIENCVACKRKKAKLDAKTQKDSE